MAVIGLTAAVEDVYKYISSAILAKQCVLQSTRWHNREEAVAVQHPPGTVGCASAGPAGARLAAQAAFPVLGQTGLSLQVLAEECPACCHTIRA